MLAPIAVYTMWDVRSIVHTIRPVKERFPILYGFNIHTHTHTHTGWNANVHPNVLLVSCCYTTTIKVCPLIYIVSAVCTERAQYMISAPRINLRCGYIKRD